MPTYVRTDKCDGCRGRDKAECMYICPHDLMLLDADGNACINGRWAAQLRSSFAG